MRNAHMLAHPNSEHSHLRLALPKDVIPIRLFVWMDQAARGWWTCRDHRDGTDCANTCSSETSLAVQFLYPA